MRRIESLTESEPGMQNKEFEEEIVSFSQDLARVNFGEQKAVQFEYFFSRNVATQCRRVFRTRHGKTRVKDRESARKALLEMKEKQYFKKKIFEWLSAWVQKTSFENVEIDSETDATSGPGSDTDDDEAQTAGEGGSVTSPEGQPKKRAAKTGSSQKAKRAKNSEQHY